MLTGSGLKATDKVVQHFATPETAVMQTEGYSG
jgi:hypothetical protein